MINAPTKQDLPNEIHVSLVASLFGDPRTLIVGSLGTIAACLVTALKTGHWSFFLCAGLLAAVALARAYDVRSFAKIRSTVTDVETARRWELRYVIGSASYVLLMGGWCLLAFATTSDPMVQLLSFSMTLVNMIGVAGRNYGSELLVKVQLLCAGIPLIFGLLFVGDIYYLVIACVIAPFFLSFKTISDKLRQTLTAAVVAANNVRKLADRLDVALNNMGHGLVMIDRGGKIAVSNGRAAELVGAPADLFESGRSAAEAVTACMRLGIIQASQRRALLAGLRSSSSTGDSKPISLSIAGGRKLSVVPRPVSDGSSVIIIEDVTEKTRAQERIHRLAHFDSLTGLPNRVSFREALMQHLRSGGDAANCVLMYIDLDDFKQVNDTLGHPIGDELLTMVAYRLQDIVGTSGFIARLGGDEFIVALYGAAGPSIAASLAGRIVAGLSEPYDLVGHKITMGASIGVSVAPEDGGDVDTLLKRADMALYEAKAEGRGRFRFFEPELDTKLRNRRSLERDLRAALAKGQFELHYQPIVALKAMKIVSCEALIRWRHPTRGFIPPDDFISVAEEVGLIVEIGEWVLMEACREAAAWPGEVGVAVNLSALQFRDKSVIDTIQRALSASGLPPHRLKVEITETTLLSDTDVVTRTLAQLAEIGVGVSLDDFGTGYSSLSYLQKFPLQTVKIDRSFLSRITSDEKQQKLLFGIARLCVELGMTVVIEGLESFDQLAVIGESEHIAEAQGYLFAKPLPSARTRELLGLWSFNTAGIEVQTAHPRRSVG